jgi:hypothetical protein
MEETGGQVREDRGHERGEFSAQEEQTTPMRRERTSPSQAQGLSMEPRTIVTKTRRLSRRTYGIRIQHQKKVPHDQTPHKNYRLQEWVIQHPKKLI